MTTTVAATPWGDSRAVLGGGGIGQVWGATDPAEAAATVRAALDAGITCFDMAPLYGNAEALLGEVFAKGYPAQVRVGTKYMVGNPPAAEIAARLQASLDASCARLRRPFIDLFVLHGYIIADGWRGGPRRDQLDLVAMPWSLYANVIVPALEALVAAGRIGAWGFTGGPLASSSAALQAEHKPGVVQVVTNLLDAAGGMNITDDADASPAALIPVAVANRVPVMGVRALAAGALTAKLDRTVDPAAPEALDFTRARGFRTLARQWQLPPDQLAYRYALSMWGVDTIVLGAKNRAELQSFIEAQAAPRLSVDEMAMVRASAFN